MNKAGLKTSLESDGYKIEAVADWTKVNEVAGIKKYDVHYEKDGVFGTAQVKVVDDGGENETATPLGKFVDPASTFAERLYSFLRGKETGTVYAIATREMYDADQVAVVDVYTTSASDVTKTSYVVKERSDTFDFKKIV